MIVFIVGGMSYSEIRIAYEITKDKKPWEVVVGKSKAGKPVEKCPQKGHIECARVDSASDRQC